MEFKTCSNPKCNKEKPLSDFYKHSQMKDGHLNKCKECIKKNVLDHREKNIDKIREYDRKRGKSPHRLKLSTRVTKDMRNRLPQLHQGLCAELSLMLDVFNSCIETKTLPKTGSPCQEKIIELLKQSGRKPTALKVRGA